MAFISQARMVANAWLRPGNTADSSSCAGFMQETFGHIPKDKKVGLVRADSGFCTEKILGYPGRRSLNHIIATRMCPSVKNAVWGLNDRIGLSKGTEPNEMIFEHNNGKPRRYTVIRKRVEDRP